MKFLILTRPCPTLSKRRASLLLALVASCCVLPAGCRRTHSNGADELNIYGWSDYRDDVLIAEFTKTTGIKVRYDLFDSSGAVEAKLLAGGTGYDIMTVSNPYLGRQVPLDLYEVLDRSRLPGWGNADAHHAAAHVDRIRYAVGNKAAQAYIDPRILHDPDYFPPAASLAGAHQQTTPPQDFQRKMTRHWTELKAAGPP